MTLYFRYEAYVPIFCQLLPRLKNLQLNNQLPGCAHKGRKVANEKGKRWDS